MGSSSSQPPLSPMPSWCPVPGQPAPSPPPSPACLPGSGFPPSLYLPQFLTSELFRELAGASSINQSPCG